MNLYCDKLINDFKEKAIFLENYVSHKNFDGKRSSSKKSIKLGKELEKISQKLIDYYLDEFIKLLDDDNIIVQKNATEYLFPIYPKKCMGILKKYYSQLTDEIDKIGIKMTIGGYSQKQKIFMDNFRKSFKTDDLDSLNREKII